MFMDLPATIIDDIVIIPITPDNIEDVLDEMYSTEVREVQIIKFAYKLTSCADFVVETNDLPENIRLSMDLEENTILVREPIKEIEEGILLITGKPGSGKSHYVNELVKKHDEALVYRFWINSQDESLMQRLQFDSFLNDIALGVFGTQRSFTVDKLIDKIIKNNIKLIIDGLDHIENYNPSELHLYIDFITSLADGYIIVLSRPLKATVEWKSMELTNWNFDQTAIYLTMAHNIPDYQTEKNIYDVADGYPIITNFIAKHYKIHNSINITSKISDINDYYATLIDSVSTKSVLTIFATNNSFFLYSEIEGILAEPIYMTIVNEFINAYPYLFRCVMNRISLIHDSFNTYLRMELNGYSDIEGKTNNYVKESILKEEVNFMARLSSFNFDEDFYKSILIKFSNAVCLENLLDSTLDYNSITSFYNQLQRLLEKRKGYLDIYQYYMFAMIHQMVNRNDLIGNDGLIYQILVYMNKYHNIECEIFSSGIMWHTFVLIRLNEESEYKRFLNNKHFSSNQMYQAYEAFQKEQDFFEARQCAPKHDEGFESLESTDIYQFDKQDILIRYMVNIWVSKETQNDYYQIIHEFISHNEKTAIIRLGRLIDKFAIETRWAHRILSSVFYEINELGDLNEDNMFCCISLLELIYEHAPKGSFTTCNYVQSYIRLANYKNEKIDIYSVNRFWAMYYMRKDYSIYSLDDALILFEKHGLIDERTSMSIIEKAMEQSEKGIRSLMNKYLDGKDTLFINKLDQEGYFRCSDSPADIFSLMPTNINCVSEKTIRHRLSEILRYHGYGKSIEFDEICNVLLSKYRDNILEIIAYYDYSIYGKVSDKELVSLIEDHDIQLINSYKEEKKEYITFEHGNIHEEDIEFIKSNKISAIEMAKYTDGWHTCLPLVDLFKIYSKELIQQNHMEILHNAMFARISRLEYIGNWNLLLGNILLFFDIYNIEIDWSKMYSIFKWFLRVSLIYDLDEETLLFE